MRDIDAQRIFGYALFNDGKDARLSYPLEKFESDVSGRSFHNGRFIQRMREKAATLSKYDLITQKKFYFFTITNIRWYKLMNMTFITQKQFLVTQLLILDDID